MLNFVCEEKCINFVPLLELTLIVWLSVPFLNQWISP